MDYFPAFLKLDGKPCLMVGGGAIALRKARLLLTAGATLTIVSPEIVPALLKMRTDAKSLSLVRRRFRRADVEGKWLVVSATGDPAVEREVAAAAEQHRVFCNSFGFYESRGFHLLGEQFCKWYKWIANYK